jgi:hypothetical protein
MYSVSREFFSHKAIVTTFVAGMLAMSAQAHQPSSTGLGQAWPNAEDVSASPHYHVYVFVRDGIRYIQVNDLNGTVRGAVAVAGRVSWVLPVGTDAQNVTTSTQDDSPASHSEAVYDDGVTRITASPAGQNAVKLEATETDQCTNFDCTGQDVSAGNPCTNFDCTGQVVTAMNPCTNFDCTGQVVSKNGH